RSAGVGRPGSALSSLLFGLLIAAEATDHQPALRVLARFGRLLLRRGAFLGRRGADRDVVVGTAVAVDEHRAGLVRVVLLRAVDAAVMEEDRVAGAPADREGALPGPLVRIEPQAGQRIDVGE